MPLKRSGQTSFSGAMKVWRRRIFSVRWCHNSPYSLTFILGQFVHVHAQDQVRGYIEPFCVLHIALFVSCDSGFIMVQGHGLSLGMQAGLLQLTASVHSDHVTSEILCGTDSTAGN